MRQTFSIAFVCRQSKANSKGLAKIEASISLNGERTFLSLPYQTTPDVFKKSMASKRKNEIKDFCSVVASKLQTSVVEMEKYGLSITSVSLKDYYVNGYKSSYKFSEIADLFINSQRPRVGTTLTMSVFKKFQLTRDSFISEVGDMDIASVSQTVIRDYYNRISGKYKGSTAFGYMAKLKQIIFYAIEERKITSNPFNGFKIKRCMAEVEFLTSDELRVIELKKLTNDRLVKVRDCFLFQSYTGLSYSDMAGLTKEDFITCEKGMYLHKPRVKTKVSYTVFLLPKAIALLEKYNWNLPVLSNQKYNSYLGEIKDICGINKPLHSHIARHTAATQFLNQGLSIDVVAKILGHTNTSMTKHYAKLLDTTVLTEMAKLG